MVDSILEMKNICKYFAGVRANYNVNLTVRRGEVHALLGENGAGKSTLMNILYGLYKQTSGDIWLNGEKVEIDSPNKAIELGIGMVHQHFMLVPALSVIENVVLGMKSGKNGILDLKEATEKFKKIANEYHMDLDPHALVWQLSVGQQQRLEILKAIYRGAKLFILDEPTAVLTPQEVDELFKMIRQLVAQGNTIIFISHKLNEVMEICDRMTVLRLGEVIGTIEAADTNKEELAKMMVGKAVFFEYEKARIDSSAQKKVLEIKDLEFTNSRGVKALNKLNLEVKSGEVLGIAGVDGNGQTELVEIITGISKAAGGHIFLNGEDITNKSPLDILKRKVSHIPGDRLKHGVVLDMSLVENILLVNYFLPEFSKNGFLRLNFLEEYATRVLRDYQVKTPSEHELMRNLSGGNQQKVVLGRELQRKHELLIAMQPARGLDIGATEFVQSNIVKERDNGTAVLLVSTELEEIYAISDRIAVIYEGEIMGIVTPEYPVEKLGLMMAGMRLEEIETGTEKA